MSSIIDISSARFYQWGDECSSWVFLDKKELSIKLEIMPPHTKELLHFHHVSNQFVYILSGMATFEIDNEKIILNSNQGIEIQKNQVHFIKNDQESADLQFLVISQPNTQGDRTNLGE
ncbi:MAG: cupin domain-containing protein [Saprospiraceae bacterium]